MTVDFPRLLSPRLALRPIEVSDLRDLQALLAIPETTRHSNWPDAPGQEDCRQFIDNWIEMAASAKGYAWAIEQRDEPGLIGCIRFNYITRPSNVGGIGYELHPGFRGRGLMTEALRAVAMLGHDRLQLNRIEAWTLPGNPASDRVLEKAGFRFEGTLRQSRWFKGAYHDLRWFGRLAGDARSEEQAVGSGSYPAFSHPPLPVWRQ